MSIALPSPVTRSNAASTCVSSRWSQRIAVTGTSNASCSGTVRPVMKTRAPCRASSRATPRPTPLVAPVTIATLLLRLMPSDYRASTSTYWKNARRPRALLLDPGEEVAQEPIELLRLFHHQEVTGPRDLVIVH